MSFRKPTCYISYSHEDVDRVSLDALVDWLKQESENKIDIKYDIHMMPGQSIANFIRFLENADVVLMIFTPSYKEKVDDRVDGGVYKEFKVIYTRYSRLQEENNQTTKFEIIPLIFSGSKEKSLVKEFEDLLFLDFTRFRAFKKNERVPQTILNQHKEYIEKILSIIITTNSFNSPTTIEEQEKLEFELFQKTKADWNYFADLEQVFVKTHFFRKLSTQASYFLIGRKGSGKSTAALKLSHQNPKYYKGVVPVNANEIPLEQLYSYFLQPGLVSDITLFQMQVEIFKYSWLLFLYLTSMDILIKEKQNNPTNKFYFENIEPIEKFFKENLDYEDSEKKLPAYFQFCFEKATRFIEICINEARSKSVQFIPDIISKINSNNFLEKSLSGEVINAFDEIIHNCKKKILFTLDGYDTLFDEFRKSNFRYYDSHNSQEVDKRTRLEIDWIRSLLNLILEIKENKSNPKYFYSLLDFCITIPKDRFFEIREFERDSYIYNNRFTESNWTAQELATLLRKRLERISNYSSEKSSSVEERLKEVLSKNFPNIDSDCFVKLNNQNYFMPLFLYILRHTFWRPRDILIYFARILAVSKDLKKRSINMSKEIIRRIVKETTSVVIESEFINEFSSTLVNLRDVIKLFYGRNELLSYNDISDILSRIDFRFANNDENSKQINTKLTFLFEISFIGLYVNEDLKNRFGIDCKHAFYFNEGETILRLIENPQPEYNFVIHPIFCEYLQLKTEHQDVVLDLNWEYLNKIEPHLSMSF